MRRRGCVSRGWGKRRLPARLSSYPTPLVSPSSRGRRPRPAPRTTEGAERGARALTSRLRWGGRCGCRSRWTATCRDSFRAAPRAPSIAHPRTGLRARACARRARTTARQPGARARRPRATRRLTLFGPGEDDIEVVHIVLHQGDVVVAHHTAARSVREPRGRPRERVACAPRTGAPPEARSVSVDALTASSRPSLASCRGSSS